MHDTAYQIVPLGRCPHRPIRVSFRLVRTPARELDYSSALYFISDLHIHLCFILDPDSCLRRNDGRGGNCFMQRTIAGSLNKNVR